MDFSVTDLRLSAFGEWNLAKVAHRKKPFIKGLTPSGARTYTPHPVAETRRARRSGAGSFFDIVDISEGMRGRRGFGLRLFDKTIVCLAYL